ncbi:MAG: metal-dependent hydrolase [Caldilineaceae bacterium]
MQTYSHFLITTALNVPFKQRQPQVNTPWLLMGSVLPDVAFTLLTLVFWPYYLWVAPIAANQTVMSVMEYMHFDLFFRDPVWIVGHNFFHAPLILLSLGLVGFRWRHHRWGQRLLWLAVGAGLHTVLDIFTHHSDGPLIFFPINWTYRFASPISYWEPGYYAGVVSAFEHTLDLILVLYLVWLGWRRRKERHLSTRSL